jgi:ATP-dependent Clp protease, protease subunit
MPASVAHMAKIARGSHVRFVMPERPERPEKEDDQAHASRADDAFLDRAAGALFASRTVLVYGEVDTKLARTVSAQLVALAAAGEGPIRMFVHSQGGHVEAGDTIHDLVRAIAPDVTMIGTGWVASAGALIYAAAKKENRYALPNTRFLLHQPLGGMGGRASDIEIEANQILQMRERLNRTFARATGQDYETITRDTEKNFWMNAKEACAYGLVHRVVERLADVPVSHAR